MRVTIEAFGKPSAYVRGLLPEASRYLESRWALVDADLAVVDQPHADDFQLITAGGDSLSKEEYLDGIASGDINYLVWDPEEIDARVHEQS
jgi:hypothetical protein